VGLLANALLGWSWADPTAGLVIAAIELKEGVNAWHGDACCAIPDLTRTTDNDPHNCDCR
jgi:Co/Zn/Cd efflux system component